MDKDCIKEYFDLFASENNITMSAYSYFYFYMMDYLNKTKNCMVLKHPTKDAIFVYYKRNNKTYYPFLPLVKYKVCENTKQDYYEIINNFSTTLNLSLIDFVPHEIADYLGKYKMPKLDKTYLYDTNNFIKLEGSKNKPIRRYKNKYMSNNKDISIVKTERTHVRGIFRLFNEWKEEAKQRLFRLYDSTENKNIVENLEVDNKIKRFDYVLLNGEDVDAYVCLYEMYPNSKDVVLSTIKARHFIDKNEGITEYFFSETMKLMNQCGYNIVNHGSDMNLKGLRNFKLKLNPATILPNYSLKIK